MLIADFTLMSGQLLLKKLSQGLSRGLSHRLSHLRISLKLSSIVLNRTTGQEISI